MQPTQPQGPFARDPAHSVRSSELRVGRYDRTAAALIATLILVASGVTVMLAMWATAILHWDRHLVRVDWLGASGGGAESTGDEQDLAPPELPDYSQPNVRSTLQAVTDTLSRQAAFASLTSPVHTGLGMTSDGDGRRPGPGVGDRLDGVGVGAARPAWERWEIRFTSSSLSEYRKQLDYFGIELAAFGGSDTIDYAFHLANPRPETRRAMDPKSEKRIRFTWRDGTLQAYDRDLLRQAGIATDGRVICQFFSKELTETLIRLEAASGRPPEDWLKTVFGVRRSGGGYELFVISQAFMPREAAPSLR